MSASAFTFEPWPKIPRLKAKQTITEKIDGTNAQVALFEIPYEEAMIVAARDPFCLMVLPGAHNGDAPIALYAGSRTRWLDTSSTGDNFGFAKWVFEHAEELRALGPGRHFGEWWGQGIQRRYGLNERRFSLFNTARWNSDNPNRPACCSVVPVLPTDDAEEAMQLLRDSGSLAAPGWDKPEGIIVYHSASRSMYKRTFENDGGKFAHG